MYQLLLIQTLFLTAFVILFPSSVTAQVTPDNTLGSEISEVNSIDELNDQIEGGARRGENLFHSFLDFNIGEGRNVNFANPEGVSRIFSRVTGGSLSEIFGTLGVGGNAEFFF